MTQEDKQLLLEDLSTRLPYGVKVTTTNPAVESGVISGISIKGKISVSTKDADIVFECTEVMPYLRSMFSMTEEERIEFERLSFVYDTSDGSMLFSKKGFDWLNAHHFDYWGLIEKGLAIEVNESNNPYEQNKP